MIKTLTQDRRGQKSAHGQENDDDARGIEVEGRFSVIELYIFLVCNLEHHTSKQNECSMFIIAFHLLSLTLLVSEVKLDQIHVRRNKSSLAMCPITKCI